MAVVHGQISTESERRIELARRCSIAYVDDGSEVILVSGSAGLGVADERSDLDMYVFCEAGRNLSEQGDRLSKLGLWKVFETPTKRGGMLARHVINGITVDVEIVPMPVIEKVLDAVLCEFDADPEKQRVIRGLIDAFPVAGVEAWEKWHRRLEPYPPKLGVNMLRAHLHFEQLVEMKRRTLDREDPLAFYSRLTAILLNSLGSLAGLNRYYLGVAPRVLKWTELHLDRMANVPANASERMKASMREPTEKHLEELESMIVEILDLVDRLVPQVQTSYVRLFL